MNDFIMTRRPMRLPILKGIICERMKCRGSLIWPAFFLIPLIPVCMGVGNYLSNLGLLTSQWYSLWTQVTLFYACFFYAPLIGAYCAFLWRYENFNNCRNALFSLPVKVSCIYMSKFALVCIITALTQLWFMGLFVLAGKISGLPEMPPADILFWSLRGLLGAFVTAAAQFLLASRIRNFATPVALGVLGGVTGLMAANTRAGIFWPWSQMLLGMNSNRSEDVLGGESGLFFIICALYLVLLCWTGICVCRGTRRKARKADD